MKRKIPLFIIDESKRHGRGPDECDFFACTSKQLPFVGSVDILTEREYLSTHNNDDSTTAYGSPRNGFMVRVHAMELPNKYEDSDLRNLLKRAIKEIEIRKSMFEININDISDTDIINFMEIQTKAMESEIRKSEHPDEVLKASYKITSKILQDYKNK